MLKTKSGSVQKRAKESKREQKRAKESKRGRPEVRDLRFGFEVRI
jgi:hypothetical protein